MTKLSVNINKIATLRNARGGNTPDLLQIAQDAERFGAQGITIHPRPDERHIRYQDAYDLKPLVKTEFNIEGNPKIQKFVDMVLAITPTQVTLVPDGDNQLTSDHGWDTLANKDYLTDIISTFKKAGIRTSIFVDANLKMVEGAKLTEYARHYHSNKEQVIKPFVSAAQLAQEIGIGINAGHDLSLENLAYFKNKVPNLLEVSIGHALISDSLYYGLENTIQLYLKQLK